MSTLTVSPKAHAEALEAVDRWKRKYAGMQEAGEQKAGLVVGGATVIGVEALVGYMRGRYGEKKLGPVNAEIIAGTACEVLALSGIFGKWSESIALTGHATIGFALGVEAMKVGEAHAVRDRQPPRRETIETAGEELPEQEETRQPIQRRREALPQKRQRVDIHARQNRMADDVEVPEPPAKTGT